MTFERLVPLGAGYMYPMYAFSLLVLSCVGRTATGPNPFQGVLPNVYKKRFVKRGKRNALSRTVLWCDTDHVLELTFTWTNSERSRKPVQISERCITFETCVFGTQFRHGRQLITTTFFFSFSVTLSKDKIYSVYVTPTCTCIPVILFRMSTA